ncbi:FG-GAP-like repeat-containing protein, partial [Xanthovirga aplysinae]|uniref:FG-GAP-like repeat-containing protein n=1 Tax=Xanthovirga aplysinae TaxID=2529853 RepID=UPI001CA3A4DC
MATTTLLAQSTITNCNDGIDNDGDGLTDCFDPSECPNGCENFYFGLPEADCQVVPELIPEFKLTVHKTDKEKYPIDQRSGVFVGDLDGDGIPEMVGKRPDEAKIQIFNGADRTLKKTISQINKTHAFSQLAIADVDRDGDGDIFVVEDDKILVRYEYSTGYVATSDEEVFHKHQTPQLADFNQDGEPEVYVGNRIFNALTLNRLVNDEGASNQGRPAGLGSGDAYALAYDVFKPGDSKPGGEFFGAEAGGLELIAGNIVYLVDLDHGTLTKAAEGEISEMSNADGFTSIADMNGDGKIDIIVSATNNSDNAAVYVWNPYTEEQLGATIEISYEPNAEGSTAGRPNVGNFDDDDYMEIGLASHHQYNVLDYNPDLKQWENKGTIGADDGSKMTGSTLFDFEGDGKTEIIYSDEGNLYIWRWDGSTFKEVVKVTSESGTRTDYPLIADVDADGQAEIILTAQDFNGPDNSTKGYISVYESANASWVPARKVWNQHGYHVTNVNDDLTIPTHPQPIVYESVPPGADFTKEDYNSAFNGFLVQTTFLNNKGEPVFPAMDFNLVSVENPVVCESEGTFSLTFTVRNDGDHPIPANTSVTLFDGDPYNSNPNRLKVFELGAQLDVGSDAINITIEDIDIPQTLSGLYLLGNHNPNDLTDGSPIGMPLIADRVNTIYLECDYTNNISSFGITENPLPASPVVSVLNPSICPNQSVSLSIELPKADFRYIWYDENGNVLADDTNTFTTEEVSNSVIVYVLAKNRITECESTKTKVEVVLMDDQSPELNLPN